MTTTTTPDRFTTRKRLNRLAVLGAGHVGPVIARLAIRCRRLRAASARSAGGTPQVTGWSTGTTLRLEYKRGKVRLRWS